MTTTIEDRLAAIERRLAAIENRLGPTPGQPWMPRAVLTDCGCPPNTVCANVGCPRSYRITTGVADDR